jgi:hypothetical protein
MASSIQSSSSTQQVIPSAQPKPAEERAKSDLWIFREGRRQVSGPAMVRDLIKRLASNASLLDSLIQAGELEAALADLETPAAFAAAALTDALAARLIAGDAHGSLDPQQLAREIEAPETISISPPEGFTYYALHPLDFARVTERIPDRSATSAVIGIRSIGTTLSAVTTAALKAHGRTATRITVRPVGHPYARTTEFSPEQERWIAEQLSQSAQFLVVDEGPGRSGSTFLSVAEALGRLGVPRERITIVGSREFDVEGLCAENARGRWRGLHYLSTVPGVSTRFVNFPYLGGGDWRMHFLDEEHEWPESWTQMERLKFLSPDRRQFFKFEGMGPIGSEVRERAFALAAAGFSPAVADAGDGFLSYQTINGRRLQKQNVSSALLERIARYCSFRVSQFACPPGNDSELRHMLEFNVQQEFGRELKMRPGQLTSENPLLVDGRMQPYEWIAPTSGESLKTDAISHGDNHFFPGPCDIAWDLAGTVVEWDLGAEATQFLLRKFRQFSGIDVSRRIRDYMLAYCVFRLGFCKMAMSTASGSAEESRLDLAYVRYRARAERLLDLRTE